MSTHKLTPMLRQYLSIKEQHPDALLFFRMGDFYELFFEDAKIAARELQIALTSRNHDREDKIPMCGVPYHSVEEYLSHLLDKKYKVAICDQVEDPAQAKGLVKREVTRILTPGTVVEDSGLKSKIHNYLCSLYFQENQGQGALAWIDYSTGSWSGIQAKKSEELWQWVVKLQPREILCPEGQRIPEPFQELKSRIVWLPFVAYFDWKRARDNIFEHQQVSSLEPLDLEDKPQLLQVCGAILNYLRQTQKQDLSHIEAFRPLNLSRHLLLDEVSERNLELFRRIDGQKGPGTLWHVLDFTQTPMGGRMLQTGILQPWRELKTILAHQEAVSFLHTWDKLRKNLQQRLEEVFDLERLSTRIYLNRCTPKDFISLRASLENLPQVQEIMTREKSSPELPAEIQNLLSSWDNLQDIFTLLQQSLVDNPPALITEGGLFKQGFNSELDELLELTEHGQSKLKELLAQEQEANQLPKLKLGFNKVFGYYFELSKAHKGPVPEHFHRRQTLVNAERYVTEELKELEEKLFSSSEKRKNLEYELFQQIREKISQGRERIVAMAAVLARLDYWQALAQAAVTWGWTKPELHTGLEIDISKGRHPAVEASLGKANYIPNDLKLDEQGRILLITGPNMAGKSTVLRQVAIICILAQMGSFVPADSACIGICDRIFTRVGASDNLSQGQSTFMVEMVETARILRQAGKRSLVILDEIGRGTSTFDGLSLAWSVVETLAGKGKGGIRTLFATHYHELTNLESIIPGIRNFNIAVKEWRGEIIFLRRLVPGPADRSYGIEVAKLAGVPHSVTQRAKEILSRLEEKSEQTSLYNKKTFSRPQTLLPGVFAKPSSSGQMKNEPEHPLIRELKTLDTDNLTPLEALNIISKWKKNWQDNDGQDKN